MLHAIYWKEEGGATLLLTLAINDPKQNVKACRLTLTLLLLVLYVLRNLHSVNVYLRLQLQRTVADGWGPVTPSSTSCLASYGPLPFLRAVFQSLARAIFTDAELGERLPRAPLKSTRTDTTAACSPFDRGQFRWAGNALNISTAGRNLDLRWKYILGKSEWRMLP